MVFTERTPLSRKNEQGSSSTIPPELRNAFQRLFRQENLEQVQSVAASRFVDLRQSALDGDVSFRLLALAAGAALVVSALLGMLSHFVFFQLTAVLIEGYVLILGIIAIVLESKQVMLPERFLKQLYKYALFLRFVWGRGCLYFVAGTLQLSLGSLTDVIVGACVCLLGVCFIMVGIRTAAKLHQARTLLTSEHTLRSKFREACGPGKDSLDLRSFSELLASLGVPVTKRESEAAFLHLNTNDDSELTYDEFKTWWGLASNEGGLSGLVI